MVDVKQRLAVGVRVCFSWLDAFEFCLFNPLVCRRFYECENLQTVVALSVGKLLVILALSCGCHYDLKIS